MVAKFLDHNENVARASRFFCMTFLSCRYTTVTGNFLISRARFMELVDTQKNFLFLFLNLDAVLSDSTLENFAEILQIK